MERIIIVGCPGSGKSRLAAELARITGLPLIHLDNLWWRPDRTHISREEFDRLLGETLRGERWIVDGDYSRTRQVRFAACDTAIFLDYDEEVCMRGITERVGTARPDIPWTEDALDPELVDKVRRYREEERPLVYGLIDRYPKKRVLIFRTRAGAAGWLRRLEGKTETKEIFGSERIRFVKLAEELIPDYLTMINDNERVNRYLGRANEPVTPEREAVWVRERLARGEVIFSMLEKGSEAFIGNLELAERAEGDRELGIALTAGMQNKGFGTEGVAAAVRYGFERLGLTRIRLRVYPDNARARRVYEKCGFTACGRDGEDICMEIKKGGEEG